MCLPLETQIFKPLIEERLFTSSLSVSAPSRIIFQVNSCSHEIPDGRLVFDGRKVLQDHSANGVLAKIGPQEA